MKTTLYALLLMFALPLAAQSTPVPAADPWKALSFLEGTWSASTTTTGSSGGKVIGTYTFRPELGNHVFARHTTSIEGCKGPETFDCDHSDLLYVYEEAPGQPLQAIYFDNEGYVIHYAVSTPDPRTAVFLSEASKPGPHFRLMYQLKNGVMVGTFAMQMPGQTDWKAYLEWSGSKK